MATTALITELEVVNSVLSAAGDSPVQTLDSRYQPVFIIKEIIKNISRDMQTKKYWFNTERDVTLTPNTQTNKIILPFNILTFEPEDIRYVARGLTVYDKEARTTNITKDIVATYTVMLDFEELPQQARKYIQAHARVRYNNEYFGELDLKSDLMKELMEAKNELDRVHMENEDINIFRSARSYNIAYRNRR
jgi:hypothetical protein